MHPRICVNGISTFKWTMAEDLAFYKQEGIKVVNIPVLKFAADPQADIEAVKKSGLIIASTSAGGKIDLIGGNALEILKPAIDIASAVGSPSLYIIAGTTPSRMSTDEAYAAFVKILPPVCAYARSKGVWMSIEHNSHATRQTGFIHGFRDAAELSRDADIGITLEMQNCWYERHLEQLFKENVDRITIAQVSDFVVGEELRLNRRVPGDGDMPVAWMIEKLLKAGYKGYFDLEYLGPSVDKEGYASAVRRGIKWLTETLTTLGA